MSDPDDLLGKADAFLKRYHPAGHSARDDVPVLTEVVSEPQPAPSPLAQASPKAADVQELERRITQNVLDSIGPHLTKILEEPLRIRLEAHLQRLLAAFAAQVKIDIDALIRDAVARAVEAEAARRRGPSRGT